MSKETETRFEALEQILRSMMYATPGFDEAKFTGTLEFLRDRFRENDPQSALATEIQRFLAGGR